MKKIDNKYLNYGITAFLVIAASILLYFTLLRLDVIFGVILKIISILMPLIYGIAIAFLLTQLYNYFDKKIYKLLNKKFENKDKNKKYSKVISISLSVLIMLLVLFLFIYAIIPKIIASLLGIVNEWNTYIYNIENWLENILSVSPAIEKTILSMINDSSSSILEWLTTALVPNLENIMESVTTGLTDMYTFIKDFTIGIVFSVYILTNKTKFIANAKKILYRILGINKGNSILSSCRYTYKIFSGFIKGKLITSLIIGTACYIGMIIFNLPYALLISLIIAITNIIPFFGPIIGWVPSTILIAMISPIQALYFTILIIVLQQIEGNIIEPKIVGNITGISAFWVLFAIIVFGDLFGIIGMILGVPVFAVIYHFIKHRIDINLDKKGLPTDVSDYENLKYIDETTKKPIKMKNY